MNLFKLAWPGAADDQEDMSEQQVITSAHAWRGAGGGRGAASGMRLDTDAGRRELALEQEVQRLVEINPASRERLHALAEFNLSQPAIEQKPVDRGAQYMALGYAAADAAGNARFDANLEQRLNARTQKARPDAVTGERIVQHYNPNSERERVVAEEKEMRALRADARQRAAAQEMPSVVRGLAQGAGGLYATAMGAAGLAGELTGSEELRDWGLEGYRETMRGVNNISLAPTFTGIRSTGDALEWALENSGYAGFQAATTILSAGMGGLIANTVGKKALGEVVGIALNSTMQTFGSVYADAAEEARRTGKLLDLPTMLTGATVSTAIDTLVNRIGLDALTAKTFKGNALERLGKSMGTQMAVQGGTEAVQRVPEEWGAGRDPYGQGQVAQYLDEAAAGALFGIASGARGRRRPGSVDAVASVSEDDVPGGDIPPETPYQPSPHLPAPERESSAGPKELGGHGRSRHGGPNEAQGREAGWPRTDDLPFEAPQAATASAMKSTPVQADSVQRERGAQDSPSAMAAISRMEVLDSGTLAVRGDPVLVGEALQQAGIALSDIFASPGGVMVEPGSARRAQEVLSLLPGKLLASRQEVSEPAERSFDPLGGADGAAPALPTRMKLLSEGTLSVVSNGQSALARLRKAGIPEGDLLEMPGNQLHVAPRSASRAKKVLAQEQDVPLPAFAERAAPLGAQVAESMQSGMAGGYAGSEDLAMPDVGDRTGPSIESGEAQADSRKALWPKMGADGLPWASHAYTVAFEMKLKLEDFGRSRAVHFNRANAALDGAFVLDPEFAQMMERLIPGVMGAVSSTGGRKTPAGWVWEHASRSAAHGEAGVMRLVPQEQHTPGSPFWRALHPDDGARGGYSEWAIPAGAPANKKKKPKNRGEGPVNGQALPER